MGYDSLVEELGEKFRTLSPDEKIAMKNKVMSKFGLI